jgi:glycosyltransferase involved in cell wall biosynthesis
MSMQRSGSEPLFSVVIPTYGRAELLREAVGSVLAQTVDDLECLVVDDASPEPVATPPDPRVRVIRRERNGGSAAARNTGLATARGRYVAFLDDDDLWTPDRLEIATLGLRRAELALCFRADPEARTVDGRILEGLVSDTIADWLTPHLGQTAVRRSACPMFDERFKGCEDVDWWIRISRTVAVATETRVGCLVRAHGGIRHGNGVPARIEGSQLLLSVHERYFAEHPRAKAFREKRLGLLRLSEGDRRGARRALRRSLAARADVRVAWHLWRSMTPSRPSMSARAEAPPA